LIERLVSIAALPPALIGDVGRTGRMPDGRQPLEQAYEQEKEEAETRWQRAALVEVADDRVIVYRVLHRREAYR
jgi:hypothetical protein